MYWNEEVLAEICAMAKKHKWQEIDRQELNTLISFQKDTGAKAGLVRLNIYLTRKSRPGALKMTVATCLNHPKKGKTQLFRKNVTRTQLVHIMKNPRKHTGKGYYEK